MTKEYKGALDAAIKLGGEPKSIKVTIPNKETYKINDNYISVGSEVSIEFEIAISENIEEIGEMLYAYVQAAVAHSISEQKQAKGISGKAKPEPATTVPESSPAGFGPPEEEIVADPSKAPSEAEKPVPIEVKKFTLARRTDKKYQLELWQMYGKSIGRYAELKYVAAQPEMWQMIGHLVGDLDFSSMPVEYDVSWTALWEHGREFTRDDGTKGNYKDLAALRQR